MTRGAPGGTPPGRAREAAWAALVRERTAPRPVALVPELETYQATELTPLWRATSAELEGYDPNPFWCFPWAGGQALARHVLDHPALVRGRSVLDLATGSGLVALAAARAGAARVVANDVSPFCAVVVPLNAALNGLSVEVLVADLLDGPEPGAEVVLAGDVFYEEALAARALAWLRGLAGRGIEVLVGDPGRHYSPAAGVVEVARHEVAVPLEIEDRPVLTARVLRVLPY